MNAIVPIQSPRPETPWPMRRSRKPVPPDELGQRHGDAGSRGRGRRRGGTTYGRRPGVTGRALPTTRFTSIGTATAAPASAPAAPFVTREDRRERDLADEATEAGLAKELADDERAEQHDDAGPRVHEQRRRARDATPRPPAPRRNGDQLCPTTARHAGARGEHRPVGAGEQRTDRALGDVGRARTRRAHRSRRPGRRRSRRRSCARCRADRRRVSGASPGSRTVSSRRRTRGRGSRARPSGHSARACGRDDGLGPYFGSG